MRRLSLPQFARFLTYLALFGTTFGLVCHARSFAFICDDAFITLRYARNLAMHGELTYNARSTGTGQPAWERVEGFTNFLWAILEAIGFALGAKEQAIVQALGVVSCVLVTAATWFAWTRIRSVTDVSARVSGVLACATVATMPSIAAWASSGLETTLFAALATIFAGLVAETRSGTKRVAAFTGAFAGLMFCLRPEAVLFLGIGAMLFLILERRRGLSKVLAVGAGFATVALPLTLFRLVYFGALVPNTYFVKTSGHAGELWQRGLTYLRFAIQDFGISFVAICIGAVVLTSAKRSNSARAQTMRFYGRAVIGLFAIYVVRVGGDFLELYRLFVPILPLAVVIVFDSLLDVVEMLEKRGVRRRWSLVALSLGLALYARRSLHHSELTRFSTDSRHNHAGIESILWTRQQAQNWAAVGRWIHAHANNKDTMAVGAAGAMPYYADIPNVDILGLCDREVALHGDVVGTRPGHQRRATRDYLEKRRVTFLFDHDHQSDVSMTPERHGYWETHGYTWMEARIDRDRYGALSTFYMYFLVRSDRAKQIASIGEDARIITLSSDALSESVN